MSAAIRSSKLGPLLLVALFLLVSVPVSAKLKKYVSDDGRVVLDTVEDFSTVPNPHAILSLQSEDQIIVLVTAQDKRFSLTEIFDGLPSTFEGGVECVGRVLLSVDGEEAATFLLEGMFPPDATPTHHTLYVVSNHQDTEYTFMIHYPKEQGDEGFEWATRLLQDFTWQSEEK